MATIDAPITSLECQPAETHALDDVGFSRHIVLAGQVLCILVPLGDLVRAARPRAADQARFRHRRLHGDRVDHAGDRLCARRLHRLLPVLGARHRQFSGRVQRLRQRHRLVSVRGAADRRDRHPLGRGAPARLQCHAAGRRDLSAHPARADRHRFPADLRGAVGHRARGDHGRDRARHWWRLSMPPAAATSRAGCSSSSATPPTSSTR